MFIVIINEIVLITLLILLLTLLAYVYKDVTVLFSVSGR